MRFIDPAFPKIEEKYYDRDYDFKTLKFLMPAEHVEGFHAMCETHNLHPWEMFEIFHLAATAYFHGSEPSERQKNSSEEE